MPRVQPITGLVFAIDFRHNGKDAWYRVVGSLVGTLNGTATVESGGLLCNASGEYLLIALGAAAQIPGVTGCVVGDVTVPANSATDKWCVDLRPNAANSNNRVLIGKRRSSSSNVAQIDAWDNAASASTTAAGLEWTAGRDTFAAYWSGFNGGGSGVLGISTGGGAPTETTGINKTRDETDTDGDIVLGNLNPPSGTTEPWNSSIHRVACFNITNPAGIDVTGAHDTSAILDAVFPSDSLGTSRHTGYGTGASGNAVRRFF